MANPTTLRFRRNAAQLHAVQEVKREIRAADPYFTRKYLRDFRAEYQDYECVLTPAQLADTFDNSDLLLVGDYHALPACQEFTSDLLRRLSATGRRIVLGLEFVFTRDQHLLDEWMAGEMGGDGLRERIRFDLDWGYEWLPFHRLLQSGREYADAIYGLDCVPRNSLRRIATRDQHAAATIDEIRRKHPDALVVVLFGESHLAQAHLPRLLRRARPRDRMITVLQNIDALYWKAAGEPCERVDGVRVAENVVCVFNSTPLEKYESYRLYLERWRRERTASPDLAPAVYNMVAALLRFLNIDEYSPSTGTGAGFLVDQLPEVHCRLADDRVRRLMLRKGADEAEVRSVLARMGENGACYVPLMNAIFVRDCNLVDAAEEAARFVHRACRAEGRSQRAKARPASTFLPGPEDSFYGRVLQEALASFGSRALYPGRPPVREADLYALYSQPRESVEELSFCSYREYMQMIDFLVLHKDYEANCRYYRQRPELLQGIVQWDTQRSEFAIRWLGRMLGSRIYDAYVSGGVGKRFVRSLFLRNLDKAGSARTTYFVAIGRMRKPRRRGGK